MGDFPVFSGDAAAALRSYMTLGNRGVRFNRARVAVALRTSLGRAHLAAACRRLGRPRVLSAPAAARTVRSARRARTRRTRASGRVGTGSPEPHLDAGGR